MGRPLTIITSNGSLRTLTASAKSEKGSFLAGLYISEIWLPITADIRGVATFRQTGLFVNFRCAMREGPVFGDVPACKVEVI
jgi:hypothetical protein